MRRIMTALVWNDEITFQNYFKLFYLVPGKVLFFSAYFSTVII